MACGPSCHARECVQRARHACLCEKSRARRARPRRGRRAAAARTERFTDDGPGNQQYVLGDPPMAVIDPGPDDPAHLSLLLRAVPRPRFVFVTHTHRDHSCGARALAAGDGCPHRGPATAQRWAAGCVVRARLASRERPGVRRSQPASGSGYGARKQRQTRLGQRSVARHPHTRSCFQSRVLPAGRRGAPVLRRSCSGWRHAGDPALPMATWRAYIDSLQGSSGTRRGPLRPVTGSC